MKFSCFPYTPDIDVLIRHLKLMKTHSLSCVISFNEDAARLKDLEQNTGIVCTESIEWGLEHSDALFLLDNNQELIWDKYYHCIDMATAYGKQIYASNHLIEKLPDKKRTIHLNRAEQIYTIKNRYADHRLFEIKTPIVVIYGMGENCGKFECQLEFKELLDSLEYNTEWLTSNFLGSFLNMKSLPDFLYDPHISFSEKILEFNKYVFDLCDSNDPDILIISAPGGILPFTQKETNYFGEISLIISSALPVDYGILAFYYQQENIDSLINRLSDYCQHRYQIHVPIFYMARQMMVREREGNKTKQLFLSDQYIEHYGYDLNSMENVAAPLKDNRPVFQSLIAKMQKNLNTV